MELQRSRIREELAKSDAGLASPMHALIALGDQDKDHSRENIALERPAACSGFKDRIHMPKDCRL